MSTQAVVNTNMSSVSDPNAIRGNYPNGVYAYDMGVGQTADSGATVAFDLTSVAGLVGSEKFHAFAVPAGILEAPLRQATVGPLPAYGQAAGCCRLMMP